LRKQTRVGVLLVSAIFLMTVICVTPATAIKPNRWWVATSINLPPWSEENPTWIGDWWNEDRDHGHFYWYNFDPFNLGLEESPKVMKFYGIWWADWDNGNYVQGTHDGSFTYARKQYTINGRVVVATGNYADLIGRKVHDVGIVDWTGGIYGLGYSEGYFQVN
jgi:hypothetical protein